MTEATPTPLSPSPRGEPATASDAVLVVDGLVKCYGDAIAVDHVSFDVRPGEVYGLLGPNGAGKSTTLGVVAGLVRADAGSVRVAGHAIERDPVPAQRAMGVVPQPLALYPDLTVRQNLGYFARLKGFAGAEGRRVVADALAAA